MNPKIKSGILAAFAADALSLGVHWVYDTAQIEKKYGRLDRMVAPELAPFHKGRLKGEFTHYGDQMMVLFESLVASSGFDLNGFSLMWQEMFVAYGGYVDHASKETLKNFESGKSAETAGADSYDLGGAARIAPLALFYGDDADAFADAARRQTAMTHSQDQVLGSAELFARAAVNVLNGMEPVLAIQTVMDQGDLSTKIVSMVKAGFDSINEDTRQAIAGFGQMCSVDAALPSTIHLIGKYKDDLEQGLIENIMAGGDSSARGILCGFILGAYLGLDAIPIQWLESMTAYETLKKPMES